MARWEPNARERIEQAALELYAERGFDETSVADIAERAGLTERTFFRHFADKREVLFGSSTPLAELLASQVTGAPASAGPMDAVMAALEATSPLFESRRAGAKARRAIIASHPALQERELIKLYKLGEAVAGALRGRGASDAASKLAADAGIALFKLAFEQWVYDEKKRDLAHHLRVAHGELQAVTGSAARPKKATAVRRGASSR